MILERFPELLKLSDEERIRLSNELAETLFIDVGPADPDPAIISELERRWEEYQRDPSTAKPWSEVRERLRREFLSKPGA